MKLFELFDVDLNKEKDEDKRIDPEINYLDDLKFFIDNDTEMLSKNFFPAVKKHQESDHNKESYKHYVKPIISSIHVYCKKYDLDDIKNKIFNKEGVITLAKKFAEEQAKHIQNKDYDEE
jgi:hypothetical protein